VIDLHTHSTASDGTDAPDALVRKASDAGIDVLGLTDHDTVAGHAAAAGALPAGMTLVPGAEISCRADGRSVHMLAYLFDPAEPAFAAERDRIRTDRDRRAREMVRRLRDLGVPVEWDRVAALAAGGAVGRPHVARALVELGVVPDVAGAFTTEWIGHDGRAYVAKHALDPLHVIALVRGAGGVSVIAHPRASARGMSHPDELLEELAAAGLGGVEVDHPDQPPTARRDLRDLVRSLGVLATGASDYHGDNKRIRLGAETTSREAYEALVAQATGAAPIRG
jgi:predicted metal-dependent phosphoesterase TrpH